MLIRSFPKNGIRDNFCTVTDKIPLYSWGKIRAVVEENFNWELTG
jgi:hypothetical protein